MTTDGDVGTHYQVVYFPFLGLTDGEELTFGKLSVWGASRVDAKVGPGPLRERVKALLESHRVTTGRPDKSRPLPGIGVVSRGPVDFGELIPTRTLEVQELGYALFLACLSSNLELHGPNAGHDLYTAENFDFISQGFSLDRPYISEVAGVLVRKTTLGYEIGKVQFPTPSHVPRPQRFRHDDVFLAALNDARSRDPNMYRRIVDAAALFIESYHNSHSVDMRARVLLQAAAFEVLLDLPESQQRRAFKDKVEELTVTDDDRRYRYKYEVRGGKRPESRTRKGIWADRFYTLRNHIIHGERVPPSEYQFRGVQHHVLIAPVFFVHMAKKLLATALEDAGDPVRFYSRIRWHEPRQDPDEETDEYETPQIGFRAERDLLAYFTDHLAAEGH